MEVVESIRKLNKIFKTNKWVDKDHDEHVFNHFCTLLENVSDCERALLLELTERYTWISAGEYSDAITDTMNLLPDNELIKINKIILFPVIKLEDQGKAKSGVSLIYNIKGVIPLLTKYKKIKFQISLAFNNLQEIGVLKDDVSLFLIDDYIGSGDTFFSCLSEIDKSGLIKYSNIKVICISCQKETFDNISAKGISIYSKYIISRGITDHNETTEASQKKELMRTIEKNIPGARSFSLGWNQSEATITMTRTPDNTFPVFWKKFRKKNGEYFDAPFSRAESIIE